MTGLEQDRGLDGTEQGSPGQRTGRRAFLGSVAAAAVGVTVLTAGQSFPGLEGANLFGPRDGKGPQGLPVNQTAAAAAVEQLASDPAWRLQLNGGARSMVLTRDDLLGLRQREVSLPIACVEGWSVGAHWSGVRLADLLDLVNADPGKHLQIRSLQPAGAYTVVEMGPEFARHPSTLLALGLNGQTLNLDHGFPARIMAPNRPGVLQTKWVGTIEVLP
jgi:DMSO/TMAO reductase YedYZ molybdopterin-dependent catalytic subunit